MAFVTNTCTRRSLTLAAGLEEVSRARVLVRECASFAGFSADRIFDIALATSEATANAIDHQPAEAKKITVECGLSRDFLEVRVSGSGGFRCPTPTEKRTSRGLGLPLMASMADDLVIRSRPQGGTTVVLRFRLPGAGGSCAVRPERQLAFEVSA
jgi:anti-sigma regulatory factor (Ser/Thr protein kinase)